ncbi:cytochrome b/b6 domain-containing protein [Agarivorans sp. MS3-6]
MSKVHKVKVWDGFVRFYHWLQVLLLGGLWWSAEQAETEWHMALGLIFLCLLVTRIIWGLIGSSNARFSQFVSHPKQVFAECKQELRGKPAEHLGHSALGGYMIVALMGVLLLQAISGLFISDDVLAEGPLYQYISETMANKIRSIHHANVELLLILVAIHVLVILGFTLKKRRLISAMISGYRLTTLNKQALTRSGWLGFVLYLALLALMFRQNPEYFEYLF